MDPLDLLRLLLDPTRLAIVGDLATAVTAPGAASSGAAPPEAAVPDAGWPDAAPPVATTSASLAERHDLDTEVVLRALAPLVQGGVVVAVDGGYHLDVLALRAIAEQLPRASPPSARVGFGMTEEETRILAPYFRGDRLTELPTSRRKRSVVLERLALEFEPGTRYDESQVNELLRRFHPDHATLRRALVDEGLLDRGGGEYWRAGGRVV